MDKIFVLDKTYFVWADGQGSSLQKQMEIKVCIKANLIDDQGFKIQDSYSIFPNVFDHTELFGFEMPLILIYLFF